MDRKGKIVILWILLIMAFLIIAGMGFFIYKLFGERDEHVNTIASLNSQVTKLTDEKQELQNKVDTISNTLNSINEKSNNQVKNSNTVDTSNTSSDDAFELSTGSYYIDTTNEESDDDVLGYIILNEDNTFSMPRT